MSKKFSRLIRSSGSLFRLAPGILLLVSAIVHAQNISLDELPQNAFTIGLDEDVPVTSEVIQGEFESGLRYYIRENNEPAGRAELRLAVNVGSILEDDSQVGLAHFLEHMAFNGTENFEKQELVAFMESIGMRLGPGINASTSFDETIYQLQLPTDDLQNLDVALQIIDDWIDGLSLEPEEIDLERGVVMEEWRLSQGAQSRIRDQQLPVWLKDSRYAERLPIGTPENIQNFDHSDLIRFYEDWYRPELMSVIAVGDFDAAEMGEKIIEQFSSIRPVISVRERSEFDVPVTEETLVQVITDPEFPLTQVGLMYKKPAEQDSTVGGYRKSLVERLYNSMLATRLAELAREPDAPFLSASSSMSTLVRPLSVFTLNAAVEENGAQEGLEGLLTEKERVARFGFTAEELERQKTRWLRSIEQTYTNRDSRNSSSIASELTRVFLNDEPMPGLAYEVALYHRFLDDITLEEVNEVAHTWDTHNSLVINVIAPEKEGLSAPMEAELLAVLDSVESLDIQPLEEEQHEKVLLAEVPEGSPVTETREIEGQVTEWVLENGVRVYLKPTAFREDEIVFVGFSSGGTSVASDEDFIAANTAVSIITNGGLGEFSAVELQRELTGKIANVSAFINEYEEGVTGTGSPADLETLMQLIYLRMTDPRADEQFYNLFKTQLGVVLQNRDSNPQQVLSDAYTRILFQDHPRHQPPSVEMLEETDLAKSLDFYQDRFADASDFTFVFAGNIDLEKMQPLVETYLGGLPAQHSDDDWVDRGVRFPEGVIRETVYRGLEPQSSTRITFSGDFDIQDRLQRSQIQVIALILETRLRNIMREQLSGTYSVQVGRSLISQPVESYLLNVGFGSDPERADELAEIVFREIEVLQEEGPEERELADAKQALLNAYETSMETNSIWATQLVNALRYNVEPLTSDLLAVPETLDSMTVETAQAAFGKYFNTANYIHLTLMPENETGQ